MSRTNRLSTLVAFVLFVAVVAVSLASVSAQDVGPNGRILFVRDGNVWNWDNGDATELFGDGTASDARWSPDGRQVLYVVNDSSYSDLMLHDLRTGNEQQLTNNAPPAEFEPGSQLYVSRSSWARDPAWSASGRIAFIADFEESGRMALWLIETPGEGAILGPESVYDENDIEGVSLSASGALAAYSINGFDGVTYYTAVVLRDLSDGVVYPIVDEMGGVYDPAISPDEQWISVTIRSTDGVSDIWVVSRSDGVATQLTFGEQAVAANWSPDGDWLAYVRPSGDGFALAAIPMGTGSASGEAVNLGEWNGLDATSGLSWVESGS